MTRDLRAAADEAVGTDGDGASVENRTSFDVSMDEGFGAGQGGSVRRRISTGTLIMGGVVLLSGASLWSMRAIDRAAAMAPRGNKETESLVNDALAAKGRSAELPPEVAPLLNVGAGEEEVRIPLKDLQKNPFVLWEVPKTAEDDPSGEEQPAVDTRAQRINEWNQSVETVAAAIRVLSTMSSSGPQGATGIANINGHMMRIGDVFGVDGSEVEFRIEIIERDFVTVRAYSPELKHEHLVTVKVNRKW